MRQDFTELPFFKNGALFLYFRLFNTVDCTYLGNIKFADDSILNRGSLVSEATALPTVPQPLSSE